MCIRDRELEWTTAELDSTRLQLRSAQAEVDSLEAQLEAAEARREFYSGVGDASPEASECRHRGCVIFKESLQEEVTALRGELSEAALLIARMEGELPQWHEKSPSPFLSPSKDHRSPLAIPLANSTGSPGSSSKKQAISQQHLLTELDTPGSQGERLSAFGLEQMTKALAARHTRNRVPPDPRSFLV
eukprot:TRINITY_DN26828_c0_g1_i1.p1 TRINITY_DN26828_c0_g1~~TRINITY_DN26828_c0_g1_i1.p1  ORF type:complete len:188 (+),score=40.36 TRINITY_DN26828_c0_g1_i1:126-689(+)